MAYVLLMVGSARVYSSAGTTVGRLGWDFLASKGMERPPGPGATSGSGPLASTGMPLTGMTWVQQATAFWQAAMIGA